MSFILTNEVSMAWFVAHVMNAIERTVLEASHRTMMVVMKWSCRIVRVVLGSLVIRMWNGKMQKQICANRGAYRLLRGSFGCRRDALAPLISDADNK